MPGGLGIWWFGQVVSGLAFWLRWVVPGWGHAEGLRVVPGDGRFHGPAGSAPWGRCGISAGQVAGLLARVMMAAAIRVPVSARGACSKWLGHLDAAGHLDSASERCGWWGEQ